MTDTPDDEVPTDPWGNPLPPDQWPQQRPPEPPAAPNHQQHGSEPGYARPEYGQYQPPPGQPPSTEYPPQTWAPQPYTPQGYGPPWGGEPKNEGMAVGALVCGILSALCGVIGFCGILIGPVAIVLGVVARRRIRDSGGMTKGDGLALAGLVLGIIGTVASVGWLIAFAAVPELRDRISDLTSTTTTRG